MKTQQAIEFEYKQRIITNLKRDVHYYDEFVNLFLSKNGGEPVKPTEEIVKRFFDIPLPSRDIKLSVSVFSPTSFWITIRVCQNPALQEHAIQLLNDILKDNSELSIVGAWDTDYEIGISTARYSYDDEKIAQNTFRKWFKACDQKFKKNLTIDSYFKA